MGRVGLISARYRESRENLTLRALREEFDENRVYVCDQEHCQIANTVGAFRQDGAMDYAQCTRCDIRQVMMTSR